MRSTWIAAAVTTVLAAGVMTAGPSGAAPRIDEDPAPVGRSALPADAPADRLTEMGLLGNLLTSVSDFVKSARPESGRPDPAALRDRFTEVDTASRALRTAYRPDDEARNPAVPLTRTGSDLRRAAPPSIAADGPRELPARNDLDTTLSSLLAHARDLVDRAERADSTSLPASDERTAGTVTRTDPRTGTRVTTRLTPAEDASLREAAGRMSQDAMGLLRRTVRMLGAN